MTYYADAMVHELSQVNGDFTGLRCSDTAALGWGGRNIL